VDLTKSHQLLLHERLLQSSSVHQHARKHFGAVEIGRSQKPGIVKEFECDWTVKRVKY
jgi:hypothetical protein